MKVVVQNYTFIQVFKLTKTKVFHQKGVLLTVYYFCMMSNKKYLLDFYINSSIHVALAVCAMLLITLNHFHLETDWNFMFFVFFATITAYNFVKYFGIAKFHHRRLAKWLKVIQVFSFLCFVGLAIFTLRLPWITISYLIFFGIITFFYAIPFLPKRFFLDSQHNLRSIGGLKVYIIAFVWSGVTVFLPLLNEQYPITFDVYVEGFQRFLIVIALMLPFEIRDLQYDSIKLSTIPQQIGIKRTKMLGGTLLVIFFLSEFFKDEISTKAVVESLVVSVVLFLFIIFSRKEQGEYYSSFWVESIPVFWAILLLFF